jgi:hypothetical protein
MIYAIRAVGTPFTKFGTAKDAYKRLAYLQIGIPFKLLLMANADWPNKQEGVIHAYLADSLERGEWFKDSPNTRKVIDLLRDGESGYREWQRISLAGNGLTSKTKKLARLEVARARLSYAHARDSQSHVQPQHYDNEAAQHDPIMPASICG